MDELSDRPAARLDVTTDPADGRPTVEFAGELDIAGLADVEGPLAARGDGVEDHPVTEQVVAPALGGYLTPCSAGLPAYVQRHT